MVLHRPLAPEGRMARHAPSEGGRCAVASRPWVLAAAIVASAMAFIDGSVVNIALPVLQRELDAGLGALQWVVNGYALFLAALLLVGGAAGDRFGRRRVFLSGILLFALASAACALAPGIGALIAARAVQGIGAALMVPQSLAIISAAFPPEIRGRAIGTWAGASVDHHRARPGGRRVPDRQPRLAVGVLAEPAAGGGRGGAGARATSPRAGDRRPGRLDWAGAALAVARLGAGDARAVGAGRAGRAVWRAAALVAAGAVAAWGFVAVERRAEAPLVPLSLFASRAFTGANLLTLCLYGALTGVLFLLPFELIGRRGMSPAEVGLVLLPVGVIIGVLARPAGALADRLGARGFLAAGSCLVAVAAAWLGVAPGGLAVGVVLPLVLLAVGMALVVAPLTTTVMNAAPDALAGVASGVNNAASRLAGLFAVALTGAVVALVFGMAADVPGARFGVIPDAGDPSHQSIAAAFGRAWSAGHGRRGGAGRARGAWSPCGCPPTAQARRPIFLRPDP